MPRTEYRTCPLCEATCGLEITLEGDEVLSVRGDSDDVLSQGFLCPKGVAIKALHEDPDRLRTPLVKDADGIHREATWDEAFAVIAEKLPPLMERHGRDAVAVYVGNPAAHGLSPLLYGRVLLKALGSKSLFSASTVDQRPKEIAAALMFGSQLTVAVPDVDRTDYLLMLGANPYASNGSLWTVPNVRGRLQALRARGGKLVVVDPRRSRTAQEADEHVALLPGTDALFLFALVHVLYDEDLVAPGALAEHADGFEAVAELAQDFAPELVAATCGIEADTIRRVARDLAAAPRACVYGRIGTTAQRFGTLASWLVDVLNVLTGNLDREGGMMFPKAAAGQSNARAEKGPGRPAPIHRWHTRVRGLPESFGELPVAALAEEIDTPGENQVRALITVAGNPARSTPNSARLEAGLEQLEFMVSIDIYRNETTRHADVILPAPSPLEKSHYDLAFTQLSVRNYANYSRKLIDSEIPDEWRTMLRLTGVLTGQGPDADVDAIDTFVAGELARREGVDLAEVEGRVGPERLLDILLRGGPYDLTLADLEAAPHGLDLGPLEPRVPQVLGTPSGRIELAPEPIVADVPRLRESLTESRNGHLLLVGRRHLRSNNSWMHNLTMLVKGPARCTLHVHPDDATRLELADGEFACVESAAGAIEAVVEVTEDIRPGVVSLPHGWGHDAAGTDMTVAAAHPGVNANALTDDSLVDAISGNAALNGVPVTVAPVRARVVSLA